MQQKSNALVAVRSVHSLNPLGSHESLLTTSTTAESTHEIHSSSNRPCNSWKPTETELSALPIVDGFQGRGLKKTTELTLWLRRDTLFTFVALLTTMIAALVFLWESSLAQNGFQIATSVHPYMWAYGPTAGKQVDPKLKRYPDKIQFLWSSQASGDRLTSTANKLRHGACCQATEPICHRAYSSTTSLRSHGALSGRL